MKKCYPSKLEQIENFKKEYLEVGYKANFNKIIKMYTADTIVYQIINNLSRISKEEIELFYLQPLIKDLSDGIK